MRLLLLLLLAGCAHGPSPACAAACEHDNDTCMLGAHDGPSVQRCDALLGGCIRSCR